MQRGGLVAGACDSLRAPSVREPRTPACSRLARGGHQCRSSLSKSANITTSPPSRRGRARDSARSCAGTARALRGGSRRGDGSRRTRPESRDRGPTRGRSRAPEERGACGSSSSSPPSSGRGTRRPPCSTRRPRPTTAWVGPYAFARSIVSIAPVTWAPSLTPPESQSGALPEEHAERLAPGGPFGVDIEPSLARPRRVSDSPRRRWSEPRRRAARRSRRESAP